MQVKLFEVRDRATFIPCFGMLLVPTTLPGRCACGMEREHQVHTSTHPDSHDFVGERSQRDQKEGYLLSRAGFGFEYPLVLFGRLESGGIGGGCQHDPYSWPVPPRTVAEAHRYIAAHWDELKSGDVIDVEFILDEAAVPKVSESVG